MAQSLADLKKVKLDLVPIDDDTQQQPAQQPSLADLRKVKLDLTPDNPQPQQDNSVLGRLANSPLVTGINNFGGGVVNSLENVASNLYNADRLANPMLPKVNLLKDAPPPFADKNSYAYMAGQMAPGMLVNPFSKLKVGATLARYALPEATSLLGRAAASGASALGRGADAVSQGAGLGYLYGDPNTPQGNAIEGGILGGAIHGIANTIPMARNLMRTAIGNRISNLATKAANKIGFLRTPEEVGKLNEQLGDTPVNIGEVVGDPGLARGLYDIGGLMPASPVKDNAPMLVRKTYDAANDLFKSFNPGSIEGVADNIDSSNAADTLNKVLQKNYETQSNMANQNYQKVFDAAKNQGVNVNLSNYVNALKNVANSNPSVPYSGILRATVGNALRKFAPDSQKLPALSDRAAMDANLSDYANKANSDNLSLSDAHFEHSDIKDLARDFRANNDTKNARVTNQLSSALFNDLDSGLQDNPELQQQYKNANQFFNDNVAPYRDKASMDYIHELKDPDTLHNVLLDSTRSKLLEHMTPEEKNLVAYNYIAPRAKTDNMNEKFISPAMMLSRFNQLSDAAKSRLFTPEQVGKFNQLQALHDVSKEAAARLNLPYTGMRTAQEMKNLEKMAIPGLAAKTLGAVKAGALAAPVVGLGREGLNIAYSPQLREIYAKGGRIPKVAGFKPLNSILGRTPIAAVNALNQQQNEQDE